jgi:hypothetical protein
MEVKLQNEIQKRVNAFTEQDWRELEDLYNRIISHKGSFYEIGGGQELTNGAIEMPYTIEKPIVIEAREFFMSKQLIISFDWARWSEGRAMFGVNEADRFTNASLPDVIKLFMAVMRNDKFCDGAWAALFESGDGRRLFRRLLDFRPHPA